MLPGIICKHVGDGQAPALFIGHDRPIEDVPEDTGWCITCGADEHAKGELRVVDLDRYFDEDPALQGLRETLRRGHQATRRAPDQPWLVEPLPADDAAA